MSMQYERVANAVVLREKWPNGKPPTRTKGLRPCASPDATTSKVSWNPAFVKATTKSGDKSFSKSGRFSRFSDSSGVPEAGTTESSYNCSSSEVNLSVFLGSLAWGFTVMTWSSLVWMKHRSSFSLFRGEPSASSNEKWAISGLPLPAADRPRRRMAEWW